MSESGVNTVLPGENPGLCASTHAFRPHAAAFRDEHGQAESDILIISVVEIVSVEELQPMDSNRERLLDRLGSRRIITDGHGQRKLAPKNSMDAAKRD